MKRIPFLYRMIQGAIGKRFVIKHYRGGRVVMTRYPDMSGIIPSEEQKTQRRHFKRAMRYAQKIYANPGLKEEKRRLLRRPKRLFQALMKEWFKARKEKEFYCQRRINKWQRTFFSHRDSLAALYACRGLGRPVPVHFPYVMKEGYCLSNMPGRNLKWRHSVAPDKSVFSSAVQSPSNSQIHSKKAPCPPSRFIERGTKEASHKEKSQAGFLPPSPLATTRPAQSGLILPTRQQLETRRG